MGVVWHKVGVVIKILRALRAQSHLQPPQPSISSYAYAYHHLDDRYVDIARISQKFVSSKGHRHHPIYLVMYC